MQTEFTPEGRRKSIIQVVDYKDKDTNCEGALTLNIAGLGSILDTVSKDTEDTAHSCILSVSRYIFSQFLFMISVS